ncbi:MAG: class I SAM-dependent methyltransferase [Chloroflexota bacterium]
MNQKSILQRLRWLLILPYALFDYLFVFADQKLIQRTRNIRLIPNERHRRGGKYAFSEWAHVIGIFQTLIYQQLESKQGNTILDIGCGTGLLGIASEPFVGQGGKYIGLDVRGKDIDFCRQHYPSENFEFVHFEVNNPAYTSGQQSTHLKWPVESGTIDIATALSVWTHLKEEDAIFYFREIGRVLKPGGKAIVTFFLLDETYEKSLPLRSNAKGRFHLTAQDKWVFDQSSYGSDAWRHPKWAEVPESAIGVTNAGFERIVEDSGLKLIEQHHGNWKEMPGVFFQDVCIFQKI